MQLYLYMVFKATGEVSGIRGCLSLRLAPSAQASDFSHLLLHELEAFCLALTKLIDLHVQRNEDIILKSVGESRALA